jgi:hypothetical protein
MGADQFNIRQMRNNVTFCHPAPFVRYSEQDGILAASGADWFANILRKVPALQVDPKMCQEDWGVVISVSRNGKRFWVGLSMWPEGESAWLAHFHQRTFAWLQRITSAGERELDALIGDVQDTLLRDPSISRLTWYREADMNTARPNGSPTPAED